jgi:hypothetical protein
LDDTFCGFNDVFDAWYCYTASCTGTATASTCDQAAYDTTLAIFDVTGTSEIACNDDGVGCSGFTSSVDWPTIAGTSYLIRVSGFNLACGTYDLTVSCLGDVELDCPTGVGCQIPDQEGHGASGVLAATSDLNAGFTVADNFVSPAAGSISAICWWGLYINFAAGQIDCSPGPGDLFTITYFNDDAGGAIPGTVYAGPFPLTVNNKFATGNNILGISEWQFEGSHAPVSVAADQCLWMEITNNTLTGDCFWLWSTAPPGDGRSAQDNDSDGYDPGDSTDYDMGFCLDVPIAPDGCPVTTPDGDTCADALQVACDSSITVDNTFATDEATDPVFSCHFGGAANGVGSMWFTFVATDTSAFLDTNASLVGDTLLAVYDGTCGSLVEIACSEDEGVGLLSQVCVEGLTVGNTYYVQVASFSAASQGVITLTILCPCSGACCFPDGSCLDVSGEGECATLGGEYQGDGSTCDDVFCPVVPANDLCEDAIGPLSVPSITPGSTDGATTDSGFPFCGTSVTSPGVWYTVIGTGTTMTASLCTGATNYDSKLTVYCNGCLDPTCVVGIDDFCGLQSEVSWCSQTGAEYLILVHGFGGQSGPFELELFDDGVSCTGAVACLPIGACCFSDGSCQVLAELDCFSLGGEWLGDGTDCGSFGYSAFGTCANAFEDISGTGTWSRSALTSSSTATATTPSVSRPTGT